MILFKGASGQTFRMKEKPIKEGYKSWALCDSTTSYVICFTPAKRTSKATSEYQIIEGGQLNSILHYLLTFFPASHPKMTIVMDNLFTTRAVVQSLRDKGIGILGTVRKRNNYPSKQFKEAGADLRDFNSGVWDLDESRNLVSFQFLRPSSLTSQLFKWVDNNVVTIITSVHKLSDTGFAFSFQLLFLTSVEKSRKRPRTTTTNLPNVQRVWGENHRVRVQIPKAIDDYNTYMGGVDRNDQLRSYFTPKLRCRRTWLPQMIFCLNLAVTNSYVIHKGRLLLLLQLVLLLNPFFSFWLCVHT